MTQLFLDESANGASTETVTKVNNADTLRTAFITGVFDGATLELQIKAPGGTFVTPDSGTYTAPGVVNLAMASGTELQGLISSVGGSTSITLDVL